MTSPVAGTAGVQDPCAEAGRGGGAAREISVPAGPFRWETKAAPEKISLLKKKKKPLWLGGCYSRRGLWSLCPWAKCPFICPPRVHRRASLGQQPGLFTGQTGVL